MPGRCLTRRASLLLPLIFAGCAEEQRDFAPLRYNYLPPIRLNVANVEIQQHFVPSGRPPDVSQLDPVRPLDALRAMAEDRLVAVGSVGTAVFAMTDASLIRQDDVISGRVAALLGIYRPDNTRAGFAQAQVSRQHTGHIDDLRATLYDMTRMMMDAMNVEFEYQLRRNLRDWLVSDSAVPAPVQQQPLQVPAREGE